MFMSMKGMSKYRCESDGQKSDQEHFKQVQNGHHSTLITTFVFPSFLALCDLSRFAVVDADDAGAAVDAPETR